MKSFVDLHHAEAGGVGGSVIFLAEGGPAHDVVLDGGNLPPFAVLGAVVDPAHAEQVAVHEILVEGVEGIGDPVVAVLVVVNVGAVSVVLPSVQRRVLIGK